MIDGVVQNWQALTGVAGVLIAVISGLVNSRKTRAETKSIEISTSEAITQSALRLAQDQQRFRDEDALFFKEQLRRVRETLDRQDQEIQDQEVELAEQRAHRRDCESKLSAALAELEDLRVQVQALRVGHE